MVKCWHFLYLSCTVDPRTEMVILIKTLKIPYSRTQVQTKRCLSRQELGDSFPDNYSINHLSSCVLSCRMCNMEGINQSVLNVQREVEHTQQKQVHLPLCAHITSQRQVKQQQAEGKSQHRLCLGRSSGSMDYEQSSRITKTLQIHFGRRKKNDSAFTGLNKSLWTARDNKKLKLQAVLAPADAVQRLVTLRPADAPTPEGHLFWWVPSECPSKCPSDEYPLQCPSDGSFCRMGPLKCVGHFFIRKEAQSAS